VIENLMSLVTMLLIESLMSPVAMLLHRLPCCWIILPVKDIPITSSTMTVLLHRVG
jgi:hypothetical protein